MTNKAAGSIHVQVFYMDIYSFSLGKISRNGIAKSHDRLYV